MGLFMMMVTFMVCGLCLAESPKDRRRFVTGVLALLYLPVSAFLTLIKKDV